jgi:hypothetical protein
MSAKGRAHIPNTEEWDKLFNEIQKNRHPEKIF